MSLSVSSAWRRGWMALAVAVGVPLLLPTVAAANAPRCLGHKATVVAKRGQVQIFGTSGPDVIVGNRAANYIVGRGGDDVVCARRGADILRGNSGDDTLSGGRGRDTLWGLGGNDVVLGGRGQDEAVGDKGNDVINLGRGFDQIDYATVPGATLINLATGTAQGLGSDTIRGVESVFAGGPSLTEVDGDEAANKLELVDPADNVSVHGNGGNDTIECIGSCAGSQMFGDDGSDTLTGGTTADTLQGGAGLDTLYGQEGDDTLIGGPNSDSAYGGVGTDTCDAEIEHDCEL